MLTTINPTTEQTSQYPTTDQAQIPAIYAQSVKAYSDWSDTNLDQRLQLLRPALAKLEQQREEFAVLTATEMGKPITQARFELERTIEEFRYTLDNAEQWLEQEAVNSCLVRFDPLGVIGVICPWNFPFLLPLRSIVPALVTGNAVIFKPSELTPATGQAIGELFQLEDGVLQTIIGDKNLGAELVKQPLKAICFTGSTEVGRAIAISAAGRFIRVILELGGLDAAVVLSDCDIEKAAAEIVRRNAGNSGQVCNAIKRVFVEEKIYPAFLEIASSVSNKMKIGNPLEEQTEMGPLVSETQLQRVESFSSDALGLGATAHSGAKRRDMPGYFFEHTIFSNLSPQTKLLSEEPFGPLLPIMPIKNWQQGVELANSTDFGLMGSIWTEDQDLALAIANKLEVGTACINNHAAGPVGTPWGGAKSSGVGRMKTKEGLREFTNTKLIRFAPK